MNKQDLNKSEKLLVDDFKFLVELFILIFGFFGSIEGVFKFIDKINKLEYRLHIFGINILNEEYFIKIYSCIFLYIIAMIFIANIVEVLKKQSVLSTKHKDENNSSSNPREEDYILRMNNKFRKTKIRKAIFTFGIFLFIDIIKNHVFKNRGIASIDVFDKPKYWTNYDNNHIEKDIIRVTSANVINGELLIKETKEKDQNITHIEPEPIIGYEFRFTKNYRIIMRQTNDDSNQYGEWFEVSPLENCFILFIAPCKWFLCATVFLLIKLSKICQ